MRRILRNFVCWNLSRRLISQRYKVHVSQTYKDHVPEDHDFRSYGVAMIDENPVWERSVHNMCRFDPVVMVSLAGNIFWNDATKVEKFIDDI